MCRHTAADSTSRNHYLIWLLSISPSLHQLDFSENPTIVLQSRSQPVRYVEVTVQIMTRDVRWCHLRGKRPILMLWHLHRIKLTIHPNFTTFTICHVERRVGRHLDIIGLQSTTNALMKSC